MRMSRDWAFPNKNTFEMRPMRELIGRYLQSPSVDPFAGISKVADIRNDLDPDCGQESSVSAEDFLRDIDTQSVNTILFDPPYSNRQVSDCYKRLGKTVDLTTTQNSHWEMIKNEFTRILKPHGHVLSFGWTSTQMGKIRGFEIVEVLLVAHGAGRYDTICTVERKLPTLFDE